MSETNWEAVARQLHAEYAAFAGDGDGDVTPLEWFVKRYGAVRVLTPMEREVLRLGTPPAAALAFCGIDPHPARPKAPHDMDPLRLVCRACGRTDLQIYADDRGCEPAPGEPREAPRPEPLFRCGLHPDAPTRRFGDLWRCSECGRPTAVSPAAAAPREAPPVDDDETPDLARLHGMATVLLDELEDAEIASKFVVTTEMAGERTAVLVVAVGDEAERLSAFLNAAAPAAETPRDDGDDVLTVGDLAAAVVELKDRAEAAEARERALREALRRVLDRCTDGRDAADAATLEEWAAEIRRVLAEEGSPRAR